MPKIPTVQADESVRTPGPSPRVSPDDFGAGVGRAMEDLSGTLREGFDRLVDINNEVQAHDSITKAQGELSDYQQFLKTGPTNDGSQTDADGIPLPIGSPQMDPSTGLPVGPPPPEQHAELMQQKIDELKEKYGGDFGVLGGSARRMFSANFDNTARAQLLETKAHALSRINESIDSKFREDMNTRANLAVNADPLVRHTSEHETEQYIDAMVQRGLYTPKQAEEVKQNFVHQVELGTIRNIMKNPLRQDANGNSTGEDGATDVIKAIDSGEFNKLPADVLQKQREMALNQHVHNLNQVDEAQRHSDVALERARKESDRANALKLAVNFTKGSLTPQQVMGLAQQGKISPETALQYGKLASGGDNIPSDRNTLIALTNRAFNGEDITEDLNSAAGKRLINPSNYAELRRTQAEYANTFKANPAAKEAFDWVHGQMGGDSLTKLPAQNAAEANVKQALHNFMRDNPRAKPQEMLDEAQQLVRRASLFDKEGMTTSMLSPRFYKGTKSQLVGGSASLEDMKTAYDDTVAAEQKGQISAAESKREKALIAQWTKTLNLQPKQQAAKK